MRLFALLASMCVAIFALQGRAFATDASFSWATTFSSPTGEYPVAFSVDAAGNSCVVSNATFAGPNNYWFVRKIDPYGHVLWSTNYVATYVASDIAADSNGNVYVTGGTLDYTNTFQLVLLKYSPTGQLLWLNSFPKALGQSLFIDSSGNCFVGASYGTVGNQVALLLEYSPAGQQLENVSRPEVAPGSSFFLANGSLVAVGGVPGTNNPAYAVISPTGTYMFGSTATSDSANSFGFKVTADPSSNVYAMLTDYELQNGTSWFNVNCYSPAGTNIWTTLTQTGFAVSITASDTNHTYVVASSGSGYADYGYGNGGAQFMNMQALPGQVAADGTTGLMGVSANSTTITFTEVNRDLQTLWNATGAINSCSPAYFKVINGTGYVAGQYYDGTTSGTFVSKVCQGVSLSALSAASTVQGGSPLTVTITLNNAAPAGGVAVALSGSAAFIGLPSQIVFSAGKTSAAFNVSTLPIDAPTPVTITAQANGVTRTTTVTVEPASMTSLTFPGGSSATVKGGQTITGTVHLSGVTGLAGRAVALSSNSASATVPSQVVVQPGQSSVSFTVQTSAVTTNTLVTIKASVSGGSSKSASFTITP